MVDFSVYMTERTSLNVECVCVCLVIGCIQTPVGYKKFLLTTCVCDRFYGITYWHVCMFIFNIIQTAYMFHHICKPLYLFAFVFHVISWLEIVKICLFV